MGKQMLFPLYLRQLLFMATCPIVRLCIFIIYLKLFESGKPHLFHNNPLTA